MNSNAPPSANRLHLEVIASERNAIQKYAAHTRVIIATADGRETNEIMRRSWLSKPIVGRWQRHFTREGVE